LRSSQDRGLIAKAVHTATVGAQQVFASMHWRAASDWPETFEVARRRSAAAENRRRAT